MSTTQTELAEVTSSTPVTSTDDGLQDPLVCMQPKTEDQVCEMPDPEDQVCEPAPPTDAEKLASAVGESNWAAAWSHFVKLDASAQKAAWAGYTADVRKSFASGLSHGSTKSNQGALQVMFSNTPDAEYDTLEKLFEVRFNVSVGQTKSPSKTGKDFDAKGLKRCWTLLVDLPPKHVEGNAWLEHWTRYEGGGAGSGFYSSSRKESSIAYDPTKMNKENKAADPGDPLYDVVRFNKVVRHEVGHAVDKKLGASDTYCIGNAAGGNWEKHGAVTDALVTTMVTASKGGISKIKKAEHKKAIIQRIRKSLAARKPDELAAKVGALSLWTDADAPTADEKTAALADPIFDAMKANGPKKNPWYNADGGGEALDGRVYQESYSGRWTSYDQSAWGKKVSQYQFRAPGEWFAEAYATYYEPDTDGNVGTLLAGTDATTKDWIDKNVHDK